MYHVSLFYWYRFKKVWRFGGRLLFRTGQSETQIQMIKTTIEPMGESQGRSRDVTWSGV